MDKCFIISSDHEFIKDLTKFKKDKENQRLFVVDFMKEYGIEANRFIVGGDGFVNIPFDEEDKSDIRFSIAATDSDILKFDKMLKKPNKHNGLRGFKKRSKIMKEFAQRCVDSKIVINLHAPSISDYFKKIKYNRHSMVYFILDGIHYICIGANSLDDEVDGFTEIKHSEFYLKKEEFDLNRNKKQQI